MSDLAMAREQREAFLTELRVGLLAVAAAPGEPPVLGPIWYAFEPGGDLLMNIGATSAKATALRAAGTASLCVQDEALPYRFVTVAGPVVLEPADDDLRRAIAARYLPADLVDGYLASGSSADMLTVRLTPSRWRSNDFSKHPG